MSHAGDSGITLTKAQATQYAKLLTGASRALGGYANVRSATAKLKSGTENLSSGVSALKKNTAKLKSGGAHLASGVSKLSVNTSKLASGTDSLVSGVGNLESGVDKLGSGVDKMDTGVGKLQSKLSEGVSKADDNLGNVSSATYDQAGTPVKLEKSEMTSVDTFGNSMAAFFLTIGAWVGAMAFCMMYHITGRKPEKGVRSWAANAAVFIPISVVWGLAELPLMSLFLAINPANNLATLLVTALAAVAFVSIIYFVNIAVGKPAMAVVLVLLSMQLASAGGIFPTSMMTGFYQVLGPWMPFTYSVEALRSTIANGNSILMPCLVLGSIVIGFNLLSILVHVKKQRRAAKNVNVAEKLEAMGIE